MWTCAMFKLMRAPVLAVALAVSLWLPHGSQHIGSLSSATTCKLPRDLTSLVWHRELPPTPLAGSEVLVLFLLSDWSDRAKGLTLGLQP